MGWGTRARLVFDALLGAGSYAFLAVLFVSPFWRYDAFDGFLFHYGPFVWAFEFIGGSIGLVLIGAALKYPEDFALSTMTARAKGILEPTFYVALVGSMLLLAFTFLAPFAIGLSMLAKVFRFLPGHGRQRPADVATAIVSLPATMAFTFAFMLVRVPPINVRSSGLRFPLLELPYAFPEQLAAWGGCYFGTLVLFELVSPWIASRVPRNGMPQVLADGGGRR